MPEAHERATCRDLNTKLFPELTREGFSLRFTGGHFAAWKLPAPGHVLTWRALGNQNAAVAMIERGGHDEQCGLNRAYSTLVSVPWQCLNFFPEPQGQSSLRPTLRSPRTNVPSAPACGKGC